MSVSALLAHPAIKDLCTTLQVPYLFPHLPLVLFSALVFSLLQAFCHAVSPLLFPKHFATFSPKTKLDWDLHFTGWIHSLIATPLALYLILHPSPIVTADPIFAYAPTEGMVFAISGGYFAYDFVVSLRHVGSHGWPFVLHATACCFIFFKAFTPFLMGVGSTFLVWEFSTMFLHIHWWLDKLDMTGSRLQLLNGVFLMASFFGARIVYGATQSIKLWYLLDDARISDGLRWGFRLASLALCGLNASWFRLMIISLGKRLETNKSGQAGDGTVRPKSLEKEKEKKQ